MAIFHFKDLNLAYRLLPRAFPNDLLLLQGPFVTADWWEPFLTEVGQVGVGKKWTGKIALIDWPGFGQSFPPKSNLDLSLETLAPALLALCKGLGLSEIRMLGHSLGSLIGLKAILKSPDLFQSATLLNPFPMSGGLKLAPVNELFQRLSKDSSELTQILQAMLYGVKVSDELKNKLFQSAEAIHPQVWKLMPPVEDLNSFKSQLRGLDKPVSIIQGEFDTFHPKTSAKEWQALFLDVQYRELQVLGHCPHIENPALLVKTYFELQGITF